MEWKVYYFQTQLWTFVFLVKASLTLSLLDAEQEKRKYYATLHL